MSTIIILIVLVFSNILAYWKERNPILFLIAGGDTLATALWSRTVMRSDIGLTISLLLLVLGIANLGYALKTLLWQPDEREESD